MKGFFITGTDTGVGKTEVAASLVRYFRSKGFKVGAIKPIATGDSKDGRILGVNSISLKLPLAPLVASRLGKERINKGKLMNVLERLKRDNRIVIVEGIGGVMVPLWKQDRKIFYVFDLISKIGLPAIIVSRPGLGTINHTLMTVDILRSKNIKIAGIVFSHTSGVKRDLSAKTNPRIIKELSGVKVLGIMHYNKKRNKRRIKWLGKAGF